jgi:hypothetical protein
MGELPFHQVYKWLEQSRRADKKPGGIITQSLWFQFRIGSGGGC